MSWSTRIWTHPQASRCRGIGEECKVRHPSLSCTVITGTTPYRLASRIVFDNRHGGNSVALMPAPGKVLSLIRMTLFGQRRRWFWNSAWSVYYLCSAHSTGLPFLSSKHRNSQPKSQTVLFVLSSHKIISIKNL